jgi:hypothetical protein
VGNARTASSVVRPGAVFGNWDSDASAVWALGFLPVDEKLNGLIRSAQASLDSGMNDKIVAAAKAIDEQAVAIPLVTGPLLVAYRADQIAADFPAKDAISNPFAEISSFQTSRK